MIVYKNEDYIKDGLSLGIFKSECCEPIPPHTHEFIEIVYILGGSATQNINGKKYESSRGDMLFMNYGSTHSFIPSEKFEYYNICFAPEIIGKRIINRENAFDLLSLTAFDEISGGKNEGVIRFVGEERHLIELLVSDMQHEYSQNMRARRAVLESYMNILISKILRKMHPQENWKNKSEKMWRELSEYIDKNLDKRLTLPDLAKKCFYNPSYFSRVFKERFDIPLAEYISRERAALAAKLLRESELGISDIAERCGYGDKSAFYRAFTKFYGITPAQYRKM